MDGEYQMPGTKRPSDDLMSASPMMTNGTGLSPNQDHDAKKAKLDAQECSRVIHIRGIPEVATDAEIVQLGMPFGKVTNVLRVKKSQAFLELEDELKASTMVNYHNCNQVQIRGKQIFIQFSKHKQLVVDQINSPQNASAKAAVMAANEMTKDCGCILRVIIENMIYPVDVNVLKAIFGRYGSVSKIITFTKNGTFQALIQYPDAVSASTAKLSLEGQNIYNGCCTLKIEYSKLTNLNVKYNNEKSFDFTKVDQLGAGGDAMSARGGMLGASNFGAGGMQAQMPQLGNYGFTNPALAGMNMRAMAGMPGQGMMIGGNSVILVSGLNEEMATPDALFTLFGVYGDVHRVKILYNKKDNALIQMADPHQAHQALTYLDKVHVWGKQLRVASSKHNVVQMPREGQPDAGLTKDFTNSPLHRFKRPGSKNCLNIYPPSAVLHLSNIPPNITEDDITQRFSEVGPVVGFKFFPKDRKMALIELKTIDEAIEALVKLHNVQLSENNHLRVSFSKSTINN